MDIVELLLFPFYIILFYFIINSIAKKFTDPVLQKYLKQLFWVKVLACLAFTIYIAVFASGDSYNLYYSSGSNISKMILSNPSRIDIFFKSAKDLEPSVYSQIGSSGYIDSPSNFSVVKISGLLCLFSFGKYLILNFLFAMLSLTGIWKLFLFFYKRYPQYYRIIALALIYLPSVQFWSSGASKEAICIAALGWITYCGYNMLVAKSQVLKNAVLLFIASYFLFTIKMYIFISYAPIFFLFDIAGNIIKSKHNIINLFLKFVIVSLSVVAIYFIFSSGQDSLGEFAVQDIAQKTFTKNELYQKIAEVTESSFNLGATLDGSVAGVVKATPFAIVATLFRPFLWEAKKLSSLISALESLFLIFITLRPLLKHGPFKFIKVILFNKTILYSFLFALVFAVFIGMTTLNFGSLIRYKIPCLPFYTLAMLLADRLLTKNKEANSNNLTQDSLVAA